METNRQAISDVINGLRALNIDDRFSNRYILSKLKSKADVLFKQDADSRRLFSINDLWKRIKCLDMHEVDLIECCIDVPEITKLMKSRHAIPNSFTSSYGNLIQVLTLKGDSTYIRTSFGQYKDIVRREVYDKTKKYFWIEDNYIFIPNSSVEKISVAGIFKNPHEVDKLNCEDNDCLSPLDSEFPAPKYILSIAIDQVVQELAGITKRIVVDEKPDLNQNIKA